MPDDTAAPGNEITVVTALFRFDHGGHERASRDYLGWSANLLPLIRWPLVVYCDAQSVAALKRLRGRKPAVWRVMRVEEFYVHRYRDIIRAHSEARWPGAHPDISLVYNEKANFMRRAIGQNVFGSEMFFWCDIGAFRARQYEPLKLSARIEYPNLRVCRALGSRVALFGRRDWVNGAWWGGTASSLHRFCDAYYDCFVRRIEQGKDIATEEAIFPEVVAMPSVDAHVFTGGDMGWLRRLKSPPPPYFLSRFGDGICAVIAE